MNSHEKHKVCIQMLRSAFHSDYVFDHDDRVCPIDQQNECFGSSSSVQKSQCLLEAVP